MSWGALCPHRARVGVQGAQPPRCYPLLSTLLGGPVVGMSEGVTRVASTRPYGLRSLTPSFHHKGPLIITLMGGVVWGERATPERLRRWRDTRHVSLHTPLRPIRTISFHFGGVMMGVESEAPSPPSGAAQRRASSLHPFMTPPDVRRKTLPWHGW